MQCATADTLLDDYAKATLEYFDAAETILAFVGSYTQFSRLGCVLSKHVGDAKQRAWLVKHPSNTTTAVFRPSKQPILKTKTRIKQKSVGQNVAEGKPKTRPSARGAGNTVFIELGNIS